MMDVFKKKPNVFFSKNNETYIFNPIIEVPVVNVAYVNPEMRRWTQESSVSFKIDDSDYDSHKGSMSESRKRQCKFKKAKKF